MDDTTGLTLLGNQKTEYPQSPSMFILETFPNKFPERNYTITHETREFTSLCPKTGQPDFGTITIRYVADKLCIESKSLKLYLFSYRNEGSFMETLTNNILSALVTVCQPRWMEVIGDFASRGGIQTTVKAEHRKSDA